MNTTVVICSAHRPQMLSETVESLLARQSVPPRAIIVSVFDPAHVTETTRSNAAVRLIVSPRPGTTVQRNAAAKMVKTPYTLFLDDDIEVASNFIESMERLLCEVPDAVAATGFVVMDGAQQDTGLDRAVARAAVAGYVRQQDDRDHDQLYGCNLFVRTTMFERVLFDENLPLYGWLEDFDFSTQCRHYGRTMLNAGTGVAHLGTPAGRNSGVRFGYSQIINPIYLWRKDRKPDLPHIIWAHWFIHFARNVKRTLLRTPSDRSDRAGRFRGNMIAFGHLLAGKVDPSYILKL